MRPSFLHSAPARLGQRFLIRIASAKFGFRQTVDHFPWILPQQCKALRECFIFCKRAMPEWCHVLHPGACLDLALTIARPTRVYHEVDPHLCQDLASPFPDSDSPAAMDSTSRLGMASAPLTLNSRRTPPATPIKCEKSEGDMRKRDNIFAPNAGWHANQSTL